MIRRSICHVIFVMFAAAALACDTCLAGQIAPEISWSNPPDIISGMRLGRGQLNATSNVPGTFIYSPSAGTVLQVGNGQILNAYFTPDDTQNYSNATAQVLINVLPMPINVTALNYAVELTATVSASPPQITLNWAADGNATSYTVYRKGITDLAWDAGTALPGDALSFTDTMVSDATAYEYRVTKTAVELSSGYPYLGYGFIYSGSNVPLIENRGKLILLVDDSFSAVLSAQLTQLQDDLIGDGWTVLRHDVSRTSAVTDIKNIIVDDYNADPQNVKCVFLLGHIPVPYAGDLNPDGHADHHGAWPADVYYANIAGTWTDSTVNDASAAAPANWNVPGDGKFDQSTIPSDLELQIGRVDLSSMPAFAQDEAGLLAQYLAKDHAFRSKKFSVQPRGMIDDNFASLLDQPACNAWRAFSAFFTPVNASSQPFVATLSAQSYLWAYGAGPGDYTSASGIVATRDFAVNDMQAVFTMLFGSYFGDWNNPDNLLRAPLCTTSYTLACAWVGRPSWYFHHMALGQTIGFSTRLSQNNDGVLYPTDVNPYQQNARQVHVALMGDPTLRLHTIAPPSQPIAVAGSSSVTLTWTPSPDTVAGYNVYRAATHAGPYTRLNNAPLTVTSYSDAIIVSGSYSYMVRAVALQSTASGTYWNASEGQIVDVQASAGALSASATPNSADTGEPLSFSAAMGSPDGNVSELTYVWTFGDGTVAAGASVTHAFAAPGVYAAQITVSDVTGQVTSTTVTVNIRAPIGPGPDTTGAGFSDALIAAAGGPPSDPGSALYGIQPDAAPQSLALTRLAIQMKFNRSGNDSIVISGKLPIPASYAAAHEPVMLILGNVMQVFRLDQRGHSALPHAGFAVQLKPKGRISTFTLQLSKGNFASNLASLGLSNATGKRKLNIPLTLIFNAQIFQTTRPVLYVAVQGKSGVTRDTK